MVAVTVGVLGVGQVLLVVVLGEVVVLQRRDLGGDVAEAGLGDDRGEDVAGREGGLQLGVGGGVDGGAVLGADVVAWRMPWVGSWFSQKAFRIASKEILAGS